MRGIALVVLIGASGCGLADYQSRMDAQRRRVQEFDEANRLLDDPIDVPRIQLRDAKENTQTERAAWDFEIFLRLPQGYTTTPRDNAPYKNFFFRYFGGSEGSLGIFIAAARVADKEQEFGRYSPATFRSYVKPALEDYYFKKYNAKLQLQEKNKPDKKEFKVVTAYPNPEAPAKISYTTFTYTDEGNKGRKEDPTAFDVYVHERSGKQVCVVVQRPLQPASAAKLKASIEACLGSLDVTFEAATKRAEYKKAKGL
jgi:hypothetical protein